MRRWTTELRFPDGSRLDLDPPSVELDHYEGDLLSAASSSAVRQASELLGDEDPYGYAVEVYKTTKAHGTRHDRTFYLTRENGRLVGRR